VADEGLRRAARIAVVGVVVTAALAGAGCGGSGQSAVQTANVGRPAEGPARPYPESPEDWGTYHSRRYRMTIALPNPRAWKIDDHSRGEIFATEAGTRSTLVVVSEDEGKLVNHAMCEERARALGHAPSGALKTIEDVVTVGPEAYDTRVWVAVESEAGGELVGHVVAYGAYLKKCWIVHLVTEVGSAEDEQALSQRLALGRVRMVGGIRVDALGAIPRVEEGGR
jgi:hypothetical protein